MKRFNPTSISPAISRQGHPQTEVPWQADRSKARCAGLARYRPGMRTAALFVSAVFVAGLACAEPRLVIDEGIGLPNPLTTEGTLGVMTQNFTAANNLSFSISQETANSLGSAVVQFDFSSASGPAFGHQVTTNTNIFDFTNGVAIISDTVSVTLTGRGLDAVGNNIVNANIVFLSGSLNDAVLPQPLPNAASLGENGFYQLVNTGVPVADLNFSVRSDVNPVPEPATFVLMLAGLAAVGSAVRRRRL